jgi:hypothetical protein
VIQGGKPEIRALLAGSKNGVHAVRYRDVGEAERAKLAEATGMDLGGFHHRIDSDAIRHIRANHGPGREDDPALEPITDEDLLAIPDIVANPDHISRGKDQATGLPSIIYKKTIQDTLVVVEEVRTGRHELALKTITKHRTKKNPAGRP